jgi:hypothetical protein
MQDDRRKNGKQEEAGMFCGAMGATDRACELRDPSGRTLGQVLAPETPRLTGRGAETVLLIRRRP